MRYNHSWEQSLHHSSEPEQEQQLADSQDVECPFCHTRGFDLIGLKGHLVHGDCEVYEGLENTYRIF